MSRRIIRNGNIVLSQGVVNGDVLIDGEKVVGITVPGAVEWSNTPEIDAGGCYVLPGVVDVHTHIQLDTGVYQTDDNWEIGTRSAAFGGVTTLVDFATQFAGQTFRQALDHRLQECQPAYIDYGLHMMVTDLARDPAQAAQDLAALRDMGVPSIKLYTTYKPNYYADDATILHTLRAMPHDMLAMFHCENDDMVADATRRLVEAGQTGWQYHAQARPSEAETEAAVRVLELARIADKAVYIVHCSAIETANRIVTQNYFLHTKAYFETCIQYLMLDAGNYAGDTPYNYIMQPPLRTGAAQAPEFLAHYASGAFHALSTDHCDYSHAKKTAQDDFRATAGGIPGLETLLPLAYTRFAADHFFDRSLVWEKENEALRVLVAVLCTNPAKLFGLYPQKGTIQTGSDADLVIYDPAPQVVIEQKNLHTIGAYCPYEGMTVQGKVRTTISRGEVLMHDGAWMGEPGRGRFLAGKPFQALESWG